MSSYRFGFLMSQNLGHRVHDRILRGAIAGHADILPTWMPIEPWADDLWQKLPVIRNNLTLLSGLRGRQQLRAQRGPFDLLYCHTQETATLLGRWMRRIPTVLSMDATPRNMDSFGQWYGHFGKSELVEHAKHALTRRTFQRAAHIVAFSDWVRQSLRADYGVPDERIAVIPSGIDPTLWDASAARQGVAHGTEDKARLLFVGGDFLRKGGDTLLEGAAAMGERWQVDIVTGDSMPAAASLANVRVHKPMPAASPELLALYRAANIFVLPTKADCTPWVVLEAMAMQLPVITTRVGGMPDIVSAETGITIEPASTGQFVEAVNQLAANPERRRDMGFAGRRRVETEFHAGRNYGRLVDLLRSVAERRARR